MTLTLTLVLEQLTISERLFSSFTGLDLFSLLQTEKTYFLVVCLNPIWVKLETNCTSRVIWLELKHPYSVNDCVVWTLWNRVERFQGGIWKRRFPVRQRRHGVGSQKLEERQQRGPLFCRSRRRSQSRGEEHRGVGVLRSGSDSLICFFASTKLESIGFTYLIITFQRLTLRFVFQ